MSDNKKKMIVDFFLRDFDFTDEELNEFFEITQFVSYKKGSYLYDGRRVCNESFFMTSGLARSYFLFDDKEVNTRLFSAPAVVCALSSYILKQPVDENIQAVTDCEGFLLKHDDFMNGSMNEARKQSVLRVGTEQHYLMMERRLLTIQYQSSAERYAFFMKTMDQEVIDKMPSYHIASYLGITPESLSRVKKKELEFPEEHLQRFEKYRH